MDLQNISNVELVNRMQKLVRTERKITHLILLHILEIESRRIYAELGYDGMYSYLTRGLGYSEAAAYRRLQSARLLKQVPEVADKIESGALHLSQLTRVQKCLKESVKKGIMISSATTLDVLEKLQNKNSFETERVLSETFDFQMKTQDVLKPQKDDSVRLEITLTGEQFKELETARSLLSHICHQGSWSEVIAVLAKKFNQKVHGTSQSVVSEIETDEKVSTSGQMEDTSEVEVAASNKIKFQMTPLLEQALEYSETFSTQGVIATKPAGRKPISIKVKRALLKNSQSCCEYVDVLSGRRCDSNYQLQIDHVVPVALGGQNYTENLRVLCRTHNLLVAHRAGLTVFSRDLMS